MTAVGCMIVSLVSVVCLIWVTLYAHKLEEELKNEAIRKSFGNREMFL